MAEFKLYMDSRGGAAPADFLALYAQKVRLYMGKKTWYVVTPTGWSVFEGSKRECNAYLKQALWKGSPAGYLSVVDKLG